MLAAAAVKLSLLLLGCCVTMGRIETTNLALLGNQHSMRPGILCSFVDARMMVVIAIWFKVRLNLCGALSMIGHELWMMGRWGRFFFSPTPDPVSEGFGITCNRPSFRYPVVLYILSLSGTISLYLSS